MEKQEVIIREMIRDESEAVAHYTKAAMKVEDERLKKLLLDIRDEGKEAEGREEAKEVLRPIDVAHHAFDKVDDIHHQLFH